MNFFSGNGWTAEDIPDMEGKKAIVTGANSGLGFEASRELARKNTHVVMACRSLSKGREAKQDIEDEVDEASLEVRKLDLASLNSVQEFAEEYKANNDVLHVLCNNAGVMALPRQETEDGFEQQFGVNHLGHFALTGLLFNVLRNTEESRVVTQSSALHETGSIHFEDLMMEENYDKWEAYAQSKLANILFAYELDRRTDEVSSIVCHPGYADTSLQYRGPEQEGSKFKLGMAKAANKILGQKASKGALPLLYSATSAEAESGDYIGPGGLLNMRGTPEKQESSEESYSEETAEALWTLSEALTDVKYGFE